MIDRHYTLSCYALERPYQAYYCQRKEIIELIDINNDIYQFRLPDFEHYEVCDLLARNWKQIGRFSSIIGSIASLLCFIKLTISLFWRTKKLPASLKMLDKSESLFLIISYIFSWNTTSKKAIRIQLLELLY